MNATSWTPSGHTEHSALGLLMDARVSKLRSLATREIVQCEGDRSMDPGFPCGSLPREGGVASFASHGDVHQLRVRNSQSPITHEAYCPSPALPLPLESTVTSRGSKHPPRGVQASQELHAARSVPLPHLFEGLDVRNSSALLGELLAPRIIGNSLAISGHQLSPHLQNCAREPLGSTPPSAPQSQLSPLPAFTNGAGPTPASSCPGGAEAFEPHTPVPGRCVWQLAE